MSALCFVDTNILVYARDASEPEKQPLAHAWLRHLWDQRCGRTSVQVLNEYYVTVTQKLDPGLPADEAWDDIEGFFSWRPSELNTDTMASARAVCNQFSLAWWDALIVSAAQRSNCEYLLSEDFQDGQDLNGMRVLNPFRHPPDAFFAERLRPI